MEQRILFIGGSPWYMNAVNRLVEKGVIERNTFSDYMAKATRGDLAMIFNCLPESEFASLAQAGQAADIPEGAAYASDAKLLYSAGVIAGTDTGEFQPQAHATRAQVAAIANRVAKPESRVQATAAPANGTDAGNGTSTAQLPADGDRIVFRGTLKAYSHSEVVALQGQGDPEADRGETYYLIVLDAPQTMTVTRGDGSGSRDGEVHLVDVTYAEGIAQYVGQNLVFSIDPARTYWPSDASLPLGEPRTDDIHVLS